MPPSNKKQILERILATVRFFDLQRISLTHFEIWKFLVKPGVYDSASLGKMYEYQEESDALEREQVSLSEVVAGIDYLCGQNKLQEVLGFIYSPGKAKQAVSRWTDYRYALVREKRIQKFTPLIKVLPFLDGVAVGGSQSLGSSKQTGDIDLLLISTPGKMFTARFVITSILHLFGVRRYKNYIANRFCLNHYLSGPIPLEEDRNIYTAMEYLRLRRISGDATKRFFEENLQWISYFFPNSISIRRTANEDGSFLKDLGEFISKIIFGKKIENSIRDRQLRRIKMLKNIVVSKQELSFHPGDKKLGLLKTFYGPVLNSESYKLAEFEMVDFH
jgi:hypothetical protein